MIEIKIIFGENFIAMKRYLFLLISLMSISCFVNAQFVIIDSIIPAHCYNSDGKVIITISGGQSPYSVMCNFYPNDSITGIDSTLTIENLYSGFYGTITIYDANSQSMQYNFYLPSPTNPQVVIDSIVNPTCYNTCNGKIFASGTGGTPPYSIGFGQYYPYYKSLTEFDNLCENNYTVQISDACGNSNSSNVYLSAPTHHYLNVDVRTDISSCTSSDGSIYVTDENGDTTLTYVWSNAATTDTVFNLSPGIYSVTVTDTVGCKSYYNNFNLNIPGSSISINEVQPLCYGQSNGKLTVSELLPPTGMNTPYIYIWNGTIGGDSLSGIPAGDYNIEVYDSTSGCSIFTSYTLGQPDSLNILADKYNLYCYGDSASGQVNINQFGGGIGYGYTALWNHDTLTSGYFYYNFYQLSAGVDTFTVTDGNGCRLDKIFNITRPDSFYAHLNKYDVSCHGLNDGHVTVRGFGGTPQYKYFIDTLNYSVGYNQQFIDSIVLQLPVGLHKIYTTDYNNCLIDTFHLEILDPVKLVIDTVGIINPTCINNNGSISFDAAGGILPYNYLLDGTTASSNNQGLAEASYQIEVKDANGCIADSTVQLVKLSQLPVIKGIVYYNSQALDSTEIYLFKADQHGASQMDTTAWLQGPNFEFNGLMPNHYFLKANYLASAFPILNTYYNQHLYWTDVDTINVGCNDTISVSLNMLSLPDTTGVCNLSGTVMFTSSKMSKAVSEPVPGAEITVEQVPGPVVIKMTQTDSSGVYTMNNLPEMSNCNLRVDIPGLPLLSTYTNLFLDAANPSLTNLNFLVDTASGGGIYVDTALFISPYSKENAFLSVFPNPFNVNTEIQISVQSSKQMSIQVFDEKGTLMFSTKSQKIESGTYRYTINRSKLNGSGVYFTVVHLDNLTYIKKMVCN